LPAKGSRLDLRANFASRIRRAMDIHIQIARVVAFELVIGKFRGLGDDPFIVALLG
jgi:hypothetical protein